MLDYEAVINWKFEDVVQSYTTRDTILYALGLGIGQNPVDSAELRHVYENGLVAFPTMAVVLAAPGAWMQDPRTGIDWVKSLHGEQGLRVYAPLPAEGTLIGRNRIVDIIDKGPGKGALLLSERDIIDASSGTLLATRTATSFLRGDGGCGAPPREQVRPAPMPERTPDHVHAIATRPEAALIYRLSGDFNPIHADPAIARKAGFDRPILHGLCTFGIIGRALIATVCGGDPSRLREMNGRFSSTIYPGETVSVEIWNQGDGAVHFRARVAERGTVAFDFGQGRIA